MTTHQFRWMISQQWRCCCASAVLFREHQHLRPSQPVLRAREGRKYYETIALSFARSVFFFVTFRNSFIRSCCYSRSKFVAAAFSTARKRAKVYSAMQCFRFRSGASSCALFFLSPSPFFYIYLHAVAPPTHFFVMNFARV